MKIEEAYLTKQALFPALINRNPVNDLKTIVVIPCFNEPQILDTLNSLVSCNATNFPIEVIIVINSAESTGSQIIEQNKRTKSEINTWKSKIQSDTLVFHVVLVEDLPNKYAGVGLARKIGMDEAVRRFNNINKVGIIVSLDADATVKPNYLAEIEKQFINHPETNCCTLNFEHPIDDKNFSQDIINAIIQYELYLRYYYHALKYTGFPHVCYSIGSCFAVNSLTYAKMGGMNKKQAGEDFYFLQKVLPLGNFEEINSTTVFPSPRISDRVPFGTGPMIQKISESDTKILMTYNFIAFMHLKELFEKTELLFSFSDVETEQFIFSLDKSLQDYINTSNFLKQLTEVKSNSASVDTFKKRFYQKFNAFWILKYLNFAHSNNIKQESVEKCVLDLMHNINTKEIIEKDLKNLLLLLRFN